MGHISKSAMRMSVILRSEGEEYLLIFWVVKANVFSTGAKANAPRERPPSAAFFKKLRRSSLDASIDSSFTSCTNDSLELNFENSFSVVCFMLLYFKLKMVFHFRKIYYDCIYRSIKIVSISHRKTDLHLDYPNQYYRQPP